MAVFNEPTKWQTSLVNSGDANTIPQSTPVGTGEASFEDGFPQITQVPIGAGGIAPDRKDFNGLFKILGDWIFFSQNGGLPTYSSDFDYVVGRYVVYNNTLYKCIQANGASSTVVAPDSVSPLGSDYWKDIENQDNTSLIPNQLIVSPVPLTDANLHLLDGALLSGSGAYSEYVTMMGALHDSDPTANIWTDEATWQTSVTNTGSCGKFVYDSLNNTLRLPKYDARYLKSTLSASDLGDLVEAKAPNITGSFNGNALNSMNNGTAFMQGAFWLDDLNTMNGVLQGGNVSHSIGFDASRSNPIYSDSATTIDTDAVKVYYYIVLGTVSKTQIQIDIDNVMADLALKADKDFSNVTAPVQAFKDMSVGWGGLDFTRAIDIKSIAVNGAVYVALFDGYIFGIIDIKINQAFEIVYGSSYDNAKILDGFANSSNSTIAGSVNIRINKGQSYYFHNTLNNTSNIVNLLAVPCKGAN